MKNASSIHWKLGPRNKNADQQMRAGEVCVDMKRRSPHLSSRLYHRWAVTHYIYSGAAQRAALIATFYSDRYSECVCERVHCVTLCRRNNQERGRSRGRSKSRQTAKMASNSSDGIAFAYLLKELLAHFLFYVAPPTGSPQVTDFKSPFSAPGKFYVKYRSSTDQNVITEKV